MRINEELLDEENEKILRKLDDTIGLSHNKAVLRDIIRCHQVLQECQCQIEFENYNIVIRNESNYNLYEDLIAVIAEVYYQNHIISNPHVFYFNREDFRKKDEKQIEEGIIVLDLNELRRDVQNLKKEIEIMIEKMPQKAFIILENEFREGEVNAAVAEYFSWFMKIDMISNEEKENYIRKFMEMNCLVCNEEAVAELANHPYYVIKNKLLTILVNCKRKEEKNVANILTDGKSAPLEKSHKTGMQELNELIGLESVKEQIKKIVSFIKVRKDSQNMPMLHMCFNGNPGTGKTTVARIVGKIFAEEEILSNNHVFVEAQRADLIGKYVGHTAPMTQRMIEKSLGGVLFIDEAYSIASYIQDEAGRDFGAECIATLLKGMEDHREDFCVILAGYTKEMQHMLKVNPGFESRIQFTIDFPDYSAEALYTIFKDFCKKEHYLLSRNIKPFLLAHFEEARKQKNFSNARYVRNLYEKVKFEQAYRVCAHKGASLNTIQKGDVEAVIKELQPTPCVSKTIGFIGA